MYEYVDALIVEDYQKALELGERIDKQSDARQSSLLDTYWQLGGPVYALESSDLTEEAVSKLIESGLSPHGGKFYISTNVSTSSIAIIEEVAGALGGLSLLKRNPGVATAGIGVKVGEVPMRTLLPSIATTIDEPFFPRDGFNVEEVIEDLAGDDLVDIDMEPDFIENDELPEVVVEPKSAISKEAFITLLGTLGVIGAVTLLRQMGVLPLLEIYGPWIQEWRKRLSDKEDDVGQDEEENVPDEPSIPRMSETFEEWWDVGLDKQVDENVPIYEREGFYTQDPEVIEKYERHFANKEGSETSD